MAKPICSYYLCLLFYFLKISESAVSQQLKILREAGLVTGVKEGYFVHYRVETEELKEIGEYIINLGVKCSDNNGCCHEEDE